MGIIYLATNLQSGKAYIGLTSKTLKYRKTFHYIAAKHARKYGKQEQYFHNALLKYPEHVWQWRILEDNVSSLKEREMYWITFYKNIGATLYNLTNGGDGQSKGYIPTEESRLKRAKAYTLLSPNGIITYVPNLRAFCRMQGFSNGSMNHVVRGRRKSAYGWRLV